MVGNKLSVLGLEFHHWEPFIVFMNRMRKNLSNVWEGRVMSCFIFALVVVTVDIPGFTGL